ncbi:ABC transporter permease [uncultured Bacteroides sp.]|uniref:ABC transporter permease n=1 Tax=uncultured Bacteroides sp. TaxID=162156 RepID=UPI00261C807E|nr:ABC transporter permease [uncultured Bacteroides sp.]
MRRFDLDTCEEIILTITRNKTRSLLTAFGVFWGIFMLVALMGGTKGVQDLMIKQFAGFATNSGFMGTNQTSKAYKGFQQGRFWELTNTDVERVHRSVPEIEVVTPNITKWDISMVYNENKTSGTLKGLYPIYAKIEEPQISMGRYINDMDILNRRKVCVLGSRIYESLFPDKSNPCGKYIEVNGIYYQVIGVNMAAGNMSVQGQAETSIIIPFSTMQNNYNYGDKNYNYGDKIQMLSFTVKKGYAVSEVQKKVESVIKRAHNVHPDDKQAVISVNAEAMFGMMDNLFSGIEVLGWMVGLGTLLAGAIGVSNIMMVTVKERTTEIGIRRAIGARPNDILSQILTESMVLTIIAGMSGISFAVFLLNIVEQALSSPTSAAHFQISFWGAIGACILLLILGLLAGLAPAFRAMAIKPIEAIRDE